MSRTWTSAGQTKLLGILPLTTVVLAATEATTVANFLANAKILGGANGKTKIATLMSLHLLFAAISLYPPFDNTLPIQQTRVPHGGTPYTPPPEGHVGIPLCVFASH